MTMDTQDAASTPTARPVVAMLLYPGMTLLDMAGPQTALSGFTEVLLVSNDLGEIMTDTGVRVLPDTAYEDCPPDVDVLFVPGGAGAAPGGTRVHVLEDEQALGFVADRGARARYVTSVCTGALVLGAAGLLHGYRAASHWASSDKLPLFGAIPSAERVTVDRNRITGGGVTAGLDFALTLVAEMAGEDAARFVQLALEYDPHPPFDSGSPERAHPDLVAQVRASGSPLNEVADRAGAAFRRRNTAVA